jgi:eukaryotic-like serine/threonine-protein kinase
VTAQGTRIDGARTRERDGALIEALDGYLEAGAWEDAARLLAHQSRYAEAGEVLLRSLPARPVAVRELAPQVRKDALNAAICFARAGARPEAVGLLVNLGEVRQAAGMLSAAGRINEAQRILRGGAVDGSPWPRGYLFRIDGRLRRTGLAALMRVDHGPGAMPQASPPRGTQSLEFESKPGQLPPAAPPELTPEVELAQTIEMGSPASRTTGLADGTVLADRYRILGELAEGGMSRIYEAEDLELGGRVALKLLKGMDGSDRGKARFRREMRLSRQLIHPNIVRTYDYGTWNGLRYLTMELLRGADLSQVAHRNGGHLSVDETLRVMAQACEGLSAAHERGIIHRDVKPQNLFWDSRTQRLKVMDFGIAKVAGSQSISVTGIVLGTPRYISPEQIDGKRDLGPSSDLYSLGVVMYELLTGTVPFEESTLSKLLLAHLGTEPERPSARKDCVPPNVEKIVMRLLRKVPEERYATCAALRRALVDAWIGHQRSSGS